MNTREVEPTVVGTAIGINYVPSDIRTPTGIKGSPGRMREYIGNGRVVGGGNGTYVTATKAHLILRVDISGKRIDVWIESVFRRLLKIKRLTQSVRQEIFKAMPHRVEVIEKKTKDDNRYYSLSETCAEEWVKRMHM